MKGGDHCRCVFRVGGIEAGELPEPGKPVQYGVSVAVQLSGSFCHPLFARVIGTTLG